LKSWRGIAGRFWVEEDDYRFCSPLVVGICPVIFFISSASLHTQEGEIVADGLLEVLGFDSTGEDIV